MEEHERLDRMRLSDEVEERLAAQAQAIDEEITKHQRLQDFERSEIDKANKSGVADPKAVLVFNVEVPIFNISQVLCFSLRAVDTKRDGIIERIKDVIEGVKEELQDTLTEDPPDPAAPLESVRKAANLNLEDWKSKIRAADSALKKVDGAKKMVETMREAYFKEISQLREQVHCMEKKGRDGTYVPDDFCLFNVADYSIDGVELPVLKQRAEMLQQRFEGHRQRIRENTEKLEQEVAAKKLLVERKDMLLSRLMRTQGIKNENDILNDATDTGSRAGSKERAGSEETSPQKLSPQATSITQRTSPQKLSPQAAPLDSQTVATPPASPSSWGGAMSRLRKAKKGPTMGGGTPMGTHLRALARKMGMMQQLKCPECDNTVMPDAKFCRKCGYDLKREESPAEEHHCECGNLLMADADFCRMCGKEVVWPEELSETASKQAPEPASPEATGSKKRGMGRIGNFFAGSRNTPSSSSTGSPLGQTKSQNDDLVLKLQAENAELKAEVESAAKSLKEALQAKNGKSVASTPQAKCKGKPGADSLLQPPASPRGAKGKQAKAEEADGASVTMVEEFSDNELPSGGTGEEAMGVTASGTRGRQAPGGHYLPGGVATTGVANILGRHGVPTEGLPACTEEPTRQSSKGSSCDRAKSIQKIGSKRFAAAAQGPGTCSGGTSLMSTVNMSSGADAGTSHAPGDAGCCMVLPSAVPAPAARTGPRVSVNQRGKAQGPVCPKVDPQGTDAARQKSQPKKGGGIGGSFSLNVSSLRAGK